MERCLSRGRGAAAKSTFFFLAALCLSLTLSEPARAQESDSVSPSEASGVVTLRDALARALERSPALAAFSAEVRAREALTVQAGLRPSLRLRSELENVGILERLTAHPLTTHGDTR